MTSVPIKIVRLHPQAKFPKRWTGSAIGYDLHALLLSETGHPIKRALSVRDTVNIPTGLAIELPPGYFGFVTSRSGLAKNSISVTNSPGLIDPDYRGEIMVMLYNGSNFTHWIEHDMRIAQLIIMPETRSHIVEVKELSKTERGAAGFGSTGR